MRKSLVVFLKLSLIALLVIYLVKPNSYISRPGAPIHFTSTDGAVINVIAPTVVSNRSYTRAESIGTFLYDFIPVELLPKVFLPGVSRDQKTPSQRGHFVADKLYPGSKDVEMVHPANVSGTSSTLAWGLASVIAGEPSIASKGLVAATGTLFPSGHVGAVGSVDIKAQSVQVAESLVTFTPAGQAKDALETFRFNNSNSIPIGVSHIEQAVGVLCVISLSSSTTCDRFLGLSSESGTAKNYLSVRLLPANKWLCTSLRFSENTDLSNIGCSRVFHKGLWYIELTSFKSRY